MSKEIVTVTSSTVACEGNGPGLMAPDTGLPGGTAPVTGHPKVYLTFKPGSPEIVCPYCSRTFVMAAGAAATAPH